MKQQILQRFFILGFLPVLLIFGVWRLFFFQPQTTARTAFFGMNTYITLTATGQNPDAALSAAEQRFVELEHLWSVTDSASDLYAINHSGGQYTSVHSETIELLSFALQMAEQTNGALEPTLYPVLSAWGFTTDKNRIPSAREIGTLLQTVNYQRVLINDNTVHLNDGMMLDLGAVGKGYAGDLLVNVLKQNGITSALLDLGGNIQALGTKPDGSDWRVGLRDPLSDGTLGVLNVHDAAVVTSGSYERYFIGEDGKRYGHIIDPSTGYPAESGLASVTIIAEEGRLCDALSTSLYVMGLDKAVAYWKLHRNFDMILVTDNGEIYLTEGAAKRFEPNNSSMLFIVDASVDRN